MGKFHGSILKIPFVKKRSCCEFILRMFGVLINRIGKKKKAKKIYLHQTFSSKATINRLKSFVHGFFSSSKFKEII